VRSTQVAIFSVPTVVASLSPDLTKLDFGRPCQLPSQAALNSTHLHANKNIIFELSEFLK
jgi:hypothetical protein